MTEASILSYGDMYYRAHSSNFIHHEVTSIGLTKYFHERSVRLARNPPALILSGISRGRAAKPCLNSFNRQILEIFRLAGATSLESDVHGMRVYWPNATAWRVIFRDAKVNAGANALIEREALDEQADDFHLVAVAELLVDGISAEDVRRATEIQRRRRVTQSYDRFCFTTDDAFVQDLKLRILHLLQRVLEASPSAALLRSLGLPLASPTDDELLRGGPSLGDGMYRDEREHSMGVQQAAWLRLAI